MIVLTEERGTEAWRAAHRNKVSASDAVAFLARPGTKRRQALIDRLVLNLAGEGLETEEFPAPWTERHEIELIAGIAAYRRHTQLHVEPCGLVANEQFPWLVASPHALVGDDGCLHVRVRYTLRAFHEYHALNRAGRARLLLTLFVTGRLWCDVTDYWNGRGVVSDRLRVRRLATDHEWLQERALPAVVALWDDVYREGREQKSIRL